MHRAQTQLSAEETTKRRLYAKYERREKQQTERHVLRKEMADHACPRLFVSRRSDKGPNGFNCAICKRDISFLSRGEPEIWRHFGSKGHFLKDRRYRLDHEEFLYTTSFDEVPVASISAELRAEIEKTPAVVLGRKNPFVEDEVDALVGVESNVPSSVLVGGLFELLRSGGSHMFLRRIWNQFRATSPVESNCAQATWSKTESLVILGQTLYPRILRRVQTWIKDSDFSGSLRKHHDGFQFFVYCVSYDSLREICVLWEPELPGLCDAEIVGLSRVFALLPADQSPVALRGCSATLFNVVREWCESQGRPKPMLVSEYTPENLKEHVQEAAKVGNTSLDPFALLDYLMLRLGRGLNQPWMMGLGTLRKCILGHDIPFASLRAVLEEIVGHWSDIKLFLSDGIASTSSRGRTPLDLNQMVLADAWVLPRLCVLHVVVVCFQANFEKQFLQEITDYSCRGYAEFCFFYWSLLSKVKKLSELPEIDDWSAYIGRPLTTWSTVSYVECLKTEPLFASVLAGSPEAIRKSFLREGYGFMMEFLKVLNSSCFMDSRLASNLSCFSPDMLLLGDESYAIELFRGLVACYQECGRLTVIDSESACNEFKSFLVEIRRSNRQVVSSIKDIFSYLRQSEALACRGSLARVVSLSSVLVVPRVVDYAEVDISLSGVAVPRKILMSAVFTVQSYVSFSGFTSGELLTKDCLDDLRVNLPAGCSFLGDASFAPWSSLYCLGHQDLYRSLRDRFDAYFLERMDDWRKRMSSLPKMSLTSAVGSSVSPSCDVTPSGDESGGQVCGSTAKFASPVTPPRPVVAAFDESALLFSPGRSSDVTRILQKRREERKVLSTVESSKSKTPSKKGKGRRK